MFALIRFMGRKCLEKHDSNVLVLSLDSGHMKAAVKWTLIFMSSECDTLYPAVRTGMTFYSSQLNDCVINTPPHPQKSELKKKNEWNVHIIFHCIWFIITALLNGAVSISERGKKANNDQV